LLSQPYPLPTRPFFSILVTFTLVLIATASCRKTPDPGVTPHVDPPIITNESITVTNAAQDHFYSLLSGVSFDAKIKGDKSDYSFLKAFLIDTLTKKTLSETSVTADGTIHFAFSPDRADKYQTQIVAQSILDTSEHIEGPEFGFYAGEPPPPDTIKLGKSDNTITITWSKSAIPNFVAYELYVVRTDTVGSLYDTLPGKLLTTITDINDTSFIHTDVFFYYSYRYHVHVITDEQFVGISAFAFIPAGTFASIGNLMKNDNFDDTRNLYYTALRNEDGSEKLVSIDPETHEVKDLIPIGMDFRFFSLAENNDYANIVTLTNVGVNNYRLYKLNLDTKVLEEKDTFSFGKGQIVAVFNNYIIYHGMYPEPPYSFIGIYNLSTGANTRLRSFSLPLVTAINHNTGFFVGSQDYYFRDSFYVYNMTADGPELNNAGLVHNYAFSEAVFTGNNVLCSGGSYFDGDFNLISTLPGTLVYTGVSRDGKYATVSDNSIRRLSDGAIVHQFGDGFYGRSYFSSDDKRLYFVNTNQSRLYRYAWSK
jgi:hypothetical protein